MLLWRGQIIRWPFFPTSISERIIFPFFPSQSNGIEDARFVCFETATSRPFIMPPTRPTTDGPCFSIVGDKRFSPFQVHLTGPPFRTREWRCFLEKLAGGSACSRQDNENIHVMFSEHPHFGYGRGSFCARGAVGVRPVGQLRVADRNRRRLACPDA